MSSLRLFKLKVAMCGLDIIKNISGVHKLHRLVRLSRLHTSKFSLTSSDLANFSCWCVKKNMSIFP